MRQSKVRHVSGRSGLRSGRVQRLRSPRHVGGCLGRRQRKHSFVCRQHLRVARIHVRSEWRWLWRQLRPFVRYEIASLLIVLVASAVTLSSPLLMKWLLDHILPQHNWRDLIIVTALFFLVSVSGTALRSTASLVAAAGVMRCAYEMRRRLVGQLVALPAAFHASGDRNFAVTGQQRGNCHLAEVKSYRIVRLVQ